MKKLFALMFLAFTAAATLMVDVQMAQAAYGHRTGCTEHDRHVDGQICD